MSETMLLEIEGLTKHYDDFTLENVALSLEPETITGLIGANGAGKTTIIKSILGSVRPGSGSIKLFGEEVASNNSAFIGQKRYAQLRQKVGFVPDTCAFPLGYDVSAVNKVCASAFSAWDAARFAKLCKDFDLSADKKIKELSRGMGMKLSMAVALSHSPELLILDEATAGLDPMARQETIALLRDIVATEGCAILMSSHITSDLEHAADRIVCIDKGKLVFNRDIDEICDLAGIAHCRASELDALLGSHAYEPGTLRIRQSSYSTDVLVPDRFQFAEAFPEIAVDRASIDQYMTLYMKGEQR